MTTKTTTAAVKTATAAKTSKKTTAAKTSKKTTAKKVASKPTAKTSGTMTERQVARACGITLPGIRVLKALANSKKEMSYRDIEKVTGYYSILTSVLRDGYEGSLGSRKYVTEAVYEETGANGHSINGSIVFKITSAGLKVLQKHGA